MSRIFHILNGDSTAEIFKQTSIAGEIIVWREMLCEGPILNDVGSDEFWMQRYSFFQDELDVNRLEYFDKTIKEIVQLEDLEGVEEVVLWFEYDLFCQINLLAVCSLLLKSYRKDVKFSLVCVGKVKGEQQLKTLADFQPKEYENLFEDRVKITRNNLVFADECWKLYVENNFEKLKQFNFNQNTKFSYLQKAINQHLKRFPFENGLNEIENKILNCIDAEPLTKEQIINKMLIWQHQETVYGFGDLQYALYLKKLDKYIEVSNSKYYLNSKGKSLIV